MTKYIFINEEGKVDLTKEEFEKILNEEYLKGLEAGKKCIPISDCPYSWVNCPYHSPYTPTYITGKSSTTTATTATGSVSNE